MLGYRNAMENVGVTGVSVAAMVSDHMFDQFSVRIEATADDYNVSLADGSKLAGSDDSGNFVEVWSFLRRRGVQTHLGKDGLIEGHCPNCGAAVEMNQNANCAHCGAMLRSGQYDWVLAEITQDSEWVASQRTDLASVEAMIARDPAFDVQDLEDRASVMFWRRSAAERIGDVRPLRKIALAEFCESYANDLKRRGSAPANISANARSDRSIRWASFRTSMWDRALVEVRWAGTVFVAGTNDPKPRKTDRTTLTRMVLELSRRSGVKSDPGKAISSSHCPNCGAPESGRDDSMTGACEFCGAVLNDGTRTWVLSAIHTPDRRNNCSLRRMMRHGTRPPNRRRRNASPASNGESAGVDDSDGAGGWFARSSRERHARNICAAAKCAAEPLDGMIAAAQQGQIDLPAPADQEKRDNGCKPWPKRRWRMENLAGRTGAA